MRVISGTGTRQEAQALLAGTWTLVAAANQNRTRLSIQNVGAKPVYLHIGTLPGGAAVDGTVGFTCLRASCTPYSIWVCGDMDAAVRGDIYALAVGLGGSSILISEF